MSDSDAPRYKSIFGDADAAEQPAKSRDEGSQYEATQSDQSTQNHSLDEDDTEYAAETDRTDEEFEEPDSAEDERSDYEEEAEPEDDTKKKLTTEYKREWRTYTRKERDISKQIDKFEARDLTRHLLNIHGLRARHHGHKDDVATDPVASMSINAATASHEREMKELDEWIPRSSWTRWPLPPKIVPRPQSKVWHSSIMRSEKTSSRTELEGQLFAFLLKTAHAQWKARNEAHTSSGSQTQATANLFARGEALSRASAMKEQQERGDRPVFSADDERSWRLLQPTVTDTVSKLDDLLEHIHKIRANSKRQYLDQRTQKIMRLIKPVDWSEVLGTAAVINLPSAAISRAATRCSAALGEKMSFNFLREEDATQPIEPPQTYRPNDIYLPPDTPTGNPNLRLFDPPFPDWDPQAGCPYKNCSWFGRRFPNSANAQPNTQLRRLTKHMASAHTWRQGGEEPPHDFEAEASGMVGGVHVDGFLQVVPAKMWRVHTWEKGQKGMRKRRRVGAVDASVTGAKTVSGRATASAAVDTDEKPVLEDMTS